MKRIRIKVKYLILIAVVVLVIIGYVFPITVLTKARKLEDKNSKEAIECYKTYASMFSLSKKDEGVLYKLGKETVPSVEPYEIFRTYKGGGENITPKMMKEATMYYEKVLKGKESGEYYPLAYKELLHIYTGMNEVEKAYKLMDKGEKSKNEEVRYISNLYRAFYLYIDKDYEGALKIVDKFIDEGLERNDLYYLKGHIHFAKGEYDEAQKYYVLADKMKIANHGENFFGTTKNIGRSNWMKDYIVHSGENKIKGRVTFKGKGIPFVQVYIKDIGTYIKSSAVGVFSPSYRNFVAITDFNGEFETPGIADGEYEIGIGICGAYLFDKVYVDKVDHYINLNGNTEVNFEFTSPFKVLKPDVEYEIKENEFVIKWEEVPEASYYRVCAINFENPEEMWHVSIMYPIPTVENKYEIKDTEAIFDLDVINRKIMEVFPEGEEMLINPTAILGKFHPGSKVGFYVVAYDEKGRMISSTLPIQTFYDDINMLKVENRELTEGEKLIFKKDYDKALKYYEEELEKNPNDIWALEYLTKIHLVGKTYMENDLDKAFDYAKKYYEVTGNWDFCMEIISNMSNEQFRNKKDEIEPILESIPEKDRDEMYYYQTAWFYLANKNFDKYEEYCEKVHDIDVKWELILSHIYQGKYEKAIERLKDENVQFVYMDKENLISGVEGLKNVDKSSKEYLVFEKFIYANLMGERDIDELFKEAYEEVKDTSMRMILREIGRKYKLTS